MRNSPPNEFKIHSFRYVGGSPTGVAKVVETFGGTIVVLEDSETVGLIRRGRNSSYVSLWLLRYGFFSQPSGSYDFLRQTQQGPSDVTWPLLDLDSQEFLLRAFA